VPHVFGPVLSKNDLIRSGDGGCSAERLARCAPKWTSESYLKHLVGTTAGLIAQVYSARECSAGVWRGYIVERRKEAGEWPSSSANRPLKSAVFSQSTPLYGNRHGIRMGRSPLFNTAHKIVYLYYLHPTSHMINVWKCDVYSYKQRINKE
jgi:hypothetical protein